MIKLKLNNINLIVYLFTVNVFICLINAQSLKSNNGSIPPFVDKDVYEENPTVAVEQALIGPFRTDPDQARTCGQLIESRGYQYERHFVTTKDGYILGNYRIVNPYARKFCKKLKPVLLVHGSFISCASWLMNDPGGHIKPWTNSCPPNDTSGALGFHLASQCFDVWLINIRGNSYSTNHTHWNPDKDKEFWDFSFQDTGLKDIPATINDIKKVTGYDRITIVALSQGTYQLIVNMAAMPEFQKNYDIVILGAAAGFLGNMRGITGLIPHLESTNAILARIHGPLPPMSAYTYGMISVTCSMPSMYPMCLESFNSQSGANSQQTNVSRIGVYISNSDRSSNKNLVHILQGMNTDHIRYFNYGRAKNLLKYGTPEPPVFPYHLIDPKKVIFMVELNDFISTIEDHQKLLNSLSGPPLVSHIVRDPLWNHINSQFAYDAYPYFTSIVRQFIEKYGDP